MMIFITYLHGAISSPASSSKGCDGWLAKWIWLDGGWRWLQSTRTHQLTQSRVSRPQKVLRQTHNSLNPIVDNNNNKLRPETGNIDMTCYNSYKMQSRPPSPVNTAAPALAASSSCGTQNEYILYYSWASVLEIKSAANINSLISPGAYTTQRLVVFYMDASSPVSDCKSWVGGPTLHLSRVIIVLDLQFHKKR